MNNEQEPDFDAWLTDMDDALERFFEQVPDRRMGHYLLRVFDFQQGARRKMSVSRAREGAVRGVCNR